MIHGKANWRQEIAETAKASRGIAPGPHKVGLTAPHMNLQLQWPMCVHVGLWPTSKALNPSWKMEVSKSAWIKPWNYVDSVWLLPIGIRIRWRNYIEELLASSYMFVYVCLYLVCIFLYILLASSYINTSSYMSGYFAFCWH